jgi:hypothetical protein
VINLGTEWTQNRKTPAVTAITPLCSFFTAIVSENLFWNRTSPFGIIRLDELRVSTMTDLNTLPFITIDNYTLSLGRALQYLQVAGKLTPLLQEIVGLHLVFETLEARSDEFTVENAEIEQKIIDFRIQEQLTDPQQFQNWLTQQGIEYKTFVQRVWMTLRIERLKAALAASQNNNLPNVNPADLEQSEIIQKKFREYVFQQWLVERMNAADLKLAIAA